MKIKTRPCHALVVLYTVLNVVVVLSTKSDMPRKYQTKWHKKKIHQY